MFAHDARIMSQQDVSHTRAKYWLNNKAVHKTSAAHKDLWRNPSINKYFSIENFLYAFTYFVDRNITSITEHYPDYSYILYPRDKTAKSHDLLSVLQILIEKV